MTHNELVKRGYRFFFSKKYWRVDRNNECIAEGTIRGFNMSRVQVRQYILRAAQDAAHAHFMIERVNGKEA